MAAWRDNAIALDEPQEGWRGRAIALEEPPTAPRPTPDEAEKQAEETSRVAADEHISLSMANELAEEGVLAVLQETGPAFKAAWQDIESQEIREVAAQRERFAALPELERELVSRGFPVTPRNIALIESGAIPPRPVLLKERLFPDAAAYPKYGRWTATGTRAWLTATPEEQTNIARKYLSYEGAGMLDLPTESGPRPASERELQMLQEAPDLTDGERSQVERISRWGQGGTPTDIGRMALYLASGYLNPFGLGERLIPGFAEYARREEASMPEPVLVPINRALQEGLGVLPEMFAIGALFRSVAKVSPLAWRVLYKIPALGRAMPAIEKVVIFSWLSQKAPVTAKLLAVSLKQAAQAQPVAAAITALQTVGEDMTWDQAVHRYGANAAAFSLISVLYGIAPYAYKDVRQAVRLEVWGKALWAEVQAYRAGKGDIEKVADLTRRGLGELSKTGAALAKADIGRFLTSMEARLVRAKAIAKQRGISVTDAWRILQKGEPIGLPEVTPPPTPEAVVPAVPAAPVAAPAPAAVVAPLVAPVQPTPPAEAAPPVAAAPKAEMRFHGSPEAGIAEVLPGPGDYGEGIYFATHKVAEHYARGRRALAAYVLGDRPDLPTGGMIYELAELPKNPLVIKTEAQKEALFREADDRTSDIARIAKEQGHDGIVDLTTGEGVWFREAPVPIKPPPAEKPAPAVGAEPKVAPPIAPGALPEAVEAPLAPEIVPATAAQKARAHVVAKEKGFIDAKGKMRQGYRRLAKGVTGQTSMKDMTQDEAGALIEALGKLPRPTYRAGKLVPPTIPKTMRVTVPGVFERPYKKPTVLGALTPQTYYAEILGVKPLVEPLERGVQTKALEFARLGHEMDKQIQQIDKLGKTTLKEKAAAKIKNRPTEAVARMRDLLDKHEEPPAELSAEETEVFRWFRNLSREMLLRENTVREALDLPPIAERKAYVRHVADTMAQEMIDGKYPFPENLKYWSERVVGKRVFNPMEMRRELSDELAEKIFTKDLAFATRSMLWTALKEIHLSHPLRFFNEQLAAVAKDMPIYDSLSPAEREAADRITTMPADTRRWLTEYVNVTIKGYPSALDRRINAIVTETGLGGLLDKTLHLFGRTLSRAPVTRFFQKMGRAQMTGVLGWRPKLIIRNKFQLVQNLALYGLKANLRGFLPATGQLESLLGESLFLKSYTGLEDLPTDVLGKLEKGWQAGYMWSATSNARQAMKVAYWDTLELIESPKYRDFGWADPQRTYTEPREFLYPSERAKMLREMEFGAGATQYQYTPIGMPGVFKHKGLIPITRLQSWWMNHWFRFHREAVTRFLSGKSGWSDGSVRLPWSRRVGWLRYLIFGGVILNTLGYGRSYLFGTAPWGLPPALTFVQGLYNYFILGLGQGDKRRRAQGKYQISTSAVTFIPGYLGAKDAAAFIETLWTGGDWSRYFFYTKKEEPKSARGRETRGRSERQRSR